MSEQEVALELMKIIRAKDPQTAVQTGKDEILALYRECLAAVRGKAE